MIALVRLIPETIKIDPIRSFGNVLLENAILPLHAALNLICAGIKTK
jgi:hypothetical protein